MITVKGNWNNIEETKPKPGQRCVVWDEEQGRPVFAYYENRGFFFKPNIGETRVVVAELWLPQPIIEDNGDDE